jgi:hypothetical protein
MKHRDEVWDKLQHIQDKINALLQIIPPTPDNKAIREEIIKARACTYRAQGLA